MRVEEGIESSAASIVGEESNTAFKSVEIHHDGFTKPGNVKRGKKAARMKEVSYEASAIREAA